MRHLLPALLLCLLHQTGAAQSFPDDFNSQVVASGLTQPTGFAFLADGRAVIVQKNGVVRLENGDIMAVVSNVHTTGEGGLTGIAIREPDVFLFYTRQSPRQIVIARYMLQGDSLVSGTDFLTFGDTFSNHNGGCLRWPAQNVLYASLGDDVMGCLAQDSTSRKGQIVSINPASGALSVVCYGLRNPFRFSVDGSYLYIGDVGGNLVEEINRSQGLENFGWPKWEGNILSAQQCGTPVDSSLVPPYISYPHDGGFAAVIGGPVYRARFGSKRFPLEYEGVYFYGDGENGWIRAHGITAPGQPDSVNWATDVGYIVDLQTGPDDALYYLALDSGTLNCIGYEGELSGVPGNPENELSLSQNPFIGDRLRIRGATTDVQVLDVAGRGVTTLRARDGLAVWSHPERRGIYFLRSGKKAAKVLVR